MATNVKEINSNNSQGVFKVLLYTKSYINSNTNKRFAKYLARYYNVKSDSVKIIDVTLSNTCKTQLEVTMKEQFIKAFPVVLTLDFAKKDFFIKDETYQRNDGTKGTKKRLCITSFSNIERGEFPQGATLDDID